MTTRLGMRALWSAAVTVAGFTAFAKIASLLKDSLVASQFGNSATLDAFLLALVLPTFLINVAAGSLPAALTPAYIALREHAGAQAARTMAGEVLAATYRILGVLAFVAAAGSLLFSVLPGTHLDPGTRGQLPWLALWLAPYTLLQGTCAAWSGMLAAERGFAVSAAAPIMLPVAVGTTLLFGGASLGVGALVAGLMLGTFAQGAILAHALRSREIPLWPQRHIRSSAVSDAIASMRRQYLPAVAGALLMSATAMIDQAMAAWLPAGSVSALNFGTKLSAVAMSVGAIALSTTLLPHLSELVARREWLALRTLQRRVAIAILATTIPATIALIAWSAPVVRLLFQHGAFTSTETALVARVQAAYLLQVPVHLLGILYVRLISALRVNRLLIVGSAVNLVVNIVLNFVFMRSYGVTGIALSTAGVYTISCIFLAWAAHRELRAASLFAAHEASVTEQHAREADGTTSEASCAFAA